MLHDWRAGLGVPGGSLLHSSPYPTDWSLGQVISYIQAKRYSFSQKLLANGSSRQSSTIVKLSSDVSLLEQCCWRSYTKGACTIASASHHSSCGSRHAGGEPPSPCSVCRGSLLLLFPWTFRKITIHLTFWKLCWNPVAVSQTNPAACLSTHSF